MNTTYPDKPPGLHPSLKARQSFIHLDRYGGQIGRIAWLHGDPAGVELAIPQADGSTTPACFFGSIRWSRFGWPITGYTDDVAWVAQAAVRNLRRRMLEGFDD